jgi:dTDP-4-dehydrorhamnose reductase
MKIHVLGSTGMLGTYISKYMRLCNYDICEYDRKMLDAINFNANEWSKNITSDDVIINCIGLLKPNILSYDHAVAINLNFPIQLDNIALKKKCRVINFSSDCVYCGSKGKYIEQDPCDADDWYGLTKRHESLQTTVLRLSFIGEERYNKIGLLEFALKNKNKTVTGYTNCLWNGVTGLEIAKIIERMIRNDGISFWSGIRNVFSNNTVSKYELLCMINEIYNLNMNVERVVAVDITGTTIHSVLDRTLDTIYPRIPTPTLYNMIREQKNFIYEY